MFSRPTRALAVLLILFILVPLPGPAQSKADTKLRIRRGQPVTVDGALAAGEWSDAERLQVEVAEGWVIDVHYKHDGANLLFAFTTLARPGQDAAQPVYRFPELLLDPQNRKSVSWQPGQWWLHASANDCEGDGEFNVYRRDGKFLCAKEKPGWRANNFPWATGVVEILVTFDKLGIKPDGARPIGLGISLTDTSNSWTFWPKPAKLESPATWGEALVVP